MLLEKQVTGIFFLSAVRALHQYSEKAGDFKMWKTNLKNLK